MAKREVEVVVISDVHLGTYGSHAKELLSYLKSIKPKILVLNGDIIDVWQFSKFYWPEAHMKVIRRIMKFVTEGVPVYYLTGNHDEMMRKFADFKIGSFQIANKLVLTLDNRKAWIFHGDVFDRTTKGWAKLLAKLGGYGYDLLILINSSVNFLCSLFGREKMSLSKQVKNGVKKAVSWINNFEQTAAELAIDNGYKYVICGHIHQPQHRVVSNDKGSVTYLNSGDWIENLTALEYAEKGWTLYQYDPKQFEHIDSRKRIKVVHLQEELTVLTNEVAFQVSI